MKADYKNWVPKGLIIAIFGGAVLALCLLTVICLGNIFPQNLPTAILKIVLIITAAVMSAVGIWLTILHCRFSYNGKRRMSWQITEGIAEYINLPAGSKGLDVGCGSGALTIACAKQNPNAEIIGIDRWGREYASFSQILCESNAKAGNVNNVSFLRGDALCLEFEDECFDAVFSNYVYHNIPSSDRQAILLETLRVLKKGGTFVIHDIFSKAKYGDMQSFLKKLSDMGYERVSLVDTTDGKFMSKTEARLMGLSGSALLMGVK